MRMSELLSVASFLILRFSLILFLGLYYLPDVIIKLIMVILSVMV
nr:MAG TPA: hypothetical protein [Crassvirales sp.]